MYKNKICLNVEILSIFLLVFFIKTYPVFSQTSQDFFYESNLNSIKKNNLNGFNNHLNQKQSDISNYANFIGYSYKEAKIDYNLSFPSYNSQSQALSQSHFHPTTTNNFYGYNYSAATAFLNPLFNLGFLATLANNNNYILPAASLAFLALSFGAFVTANDVFNVIRNFDSDESDYFNDNLSVHEMDLDYDPKQDESPKIFVDKIDKDSKNGFEKIINNSSEVIIMQKMDYLLSKLFNSSSTANDNDNLKILLFRALKLSDKELKNRLLQIASLDVVTQFSDYMDYHDHISQANIDMWNQEVFYKFLTTQITTISSLHIFLARMMKLDESLSDEYLLLKYNLGDTESAESSKFITGTINRLFDYLSSFDPVNYQLRYGPKLTRNDSYEKIKRVLLDIDPTELEARLSYNIKKYHEIDYQHLIKSKKLKLINAESLISYLNNLDHKIRLFFLITALNLIEHVEVEKLFDDGQNLSSDDFADNFIYQFIKYHSLGDIPQTKDKNTENKVDKTADKSFEYSILSLDELTYEFKNLLDAELIDLVKSSKLFEFVSYDDFSVNSELIRQFVKTKLNDDQIKLHIFFSAFLNLAPFKPYVIAKIYRLQINYVYQIKKDIFIDFHLFMKDHDELSRYLIEFFYFASTKDTKKLNGLIQNKEFFEHKEIKKYLKAGYIKNYIKFLAKSNDRLKQALFIKFIFGNNALNKSSTNLSSLINDHYPNHDYDDKQLIDLFSKGLKYLNKDDQALIALTNKFEKLSDKELVDLVKSSILFEFIFYDDLSVNSELIRQFVKTKLNDDQIKLHIFFSAFLNLAQYIPGTISQIYLIDPHYVHQIKKDIFIDFHLFIKDHDKLSRYLIEFLYFISVKRTKKLNGLIQNKEFIEHEARKKDFKPIYIKNFIKFLAKSNDRLKLALFIRFIFGDNVLSTDLSSLINDHYPNHGYDDKQLIDLFSKGFKYLNKDDPAFIALAHKFEKLSDKELVDLVKSSKLFEFISYDDLLVNSELIRQFVKTRLNDDRIKLHVFFSAYLNLAQYTSDILAKIYSVNPMHVHQIKKDIFIDFHLFVKDHDELSRYLIEFFYFASTKDTKKLNGLIQNKDFFEHEETKKHLKTGYIKNFIKFLAKSNDRLKQALFIKFIFGDNALNKSSTNLSSLINDHYPNHGYDDKQLIDLFSKGFKYLNKDDPAFIALAHKFEKLSDKELVDLVKSSKLFEFISYDDLSVNSELIRQFAKTKLNDDQIKLHVFFSAYLNLSQYTSDILAKIYSINPMHVHQIKKDIFIDFHLFVKDHDELSRYLIEFLYFISTKNTEDWKDFIQNKELLEHEASKKYFKTGYIKNYIKFLAKSNDRLKLALFIRFIFGDNVLSSDLSSLIKDYYPNHGYSHKQLIDLFSKGLKDLNKYDPAFIALAHKFENLSDEELVDLVKSSKLFEFISYDDLWLNSELIRQFAKTKLNDDQIKLHIFFSEFLNLGEYSPHNLAQMYHIPVKNVYRIKKEIFINFHLFIKDHDELSIYLIDFLYFISTKIAKDWKGFIQNKELLEHEASKKYFKTGYIKNFIKFLAKSNDRLKLALFIKFIFGDNVLSTDISSLINDHYPNHGYDDKDNSQLTDLFLDDFVQNSYKFNQQRAYKSIRDKNKI